MVQKIRSFAVLALLLACLVACSCTGSSEDRLSQTGGQPDTDDSQQSDSDSGSADAAEVGGDAHFERDTARPSASVTLPLEVIGEAGYTVEATIPLQNASSAKSLYLQTHRLAFEDASVNPDRGPKGSVRLNDGAWIGLTNDVVTCLAHEAAVGCLNGAYHTVRFTVPIDILGTLHEGENHLQFRFEGTDGVTNGWRVLAIGVRDERGEEAIDSHVFEQEDPNLWQPPHDTPEDIAEGKRLWHKQALLSDNPLQPDRIIQASCSDCHARDGRDLKYFNYSNWSIIERSRFHGLSREQGEQIASYIRSVDLELPDGLTVADLGRPWNPPYQPGPGLDDKPVEQWAAGAGIEWVLEDDIDALPYLFEQGTSAGSINSTLGPDGDINHRELPVAIQFPDWNEWLPEVHPLDIFGPDFESPAYEIGSIDIFDEYREVHERLADDVERGVQHLNFFMQRTHEHAGSQIIDVDSFEEREDTGELIMHHDGNDMIVYGSDGTERRTNREVANRGFRHWSTIKQWEILQEYGLEGHGRQIHGSTAETRSWLTDARSVFELAPHRAAFDDNKYSYQTLLVGKYFSTVWYQLQVTLNSGHGYTDYLLRPVDWNYQPSHVSNYNGQAGGPAHPLRLAATFAEMYQVYERHTPASSSFGFRQMHPARWAPGGEQNALFAEMDPELRAKIFAGLLNSLMDLLERHQPGDWSRATGGDSHTAEPADYVPVLLNDQDLVHAHHRGQYADCWLTMIPRFRNSGVDEATLERLIAWGEKMWPQGDWNSVRP